MSKVRDNKRYAIPQIKQIDVTFSLSHVWVSWRSKIEAANWFLQQDKSKKRKNKNNNKQTNIQKKREKTLKLILQHFTRFCFLRDTMVTSKSPQKRTCNCSHPLFVSCLPRVGAYYLTIANIMDSYAHLLWCNPNATVLCCFFFALVLMSSCLWRNTTTFVLSTFRSEQSWGSFNA